MNKTGKILTRDIFPDNVLVHNSISGIIVFRFFYHFENNKKIYKFAEGTRKRNVI